jgi:hypothetical protein
MITGGVEKVIEWLDNNQLTIWSVSTTNDDNTKVFDSFDDELLDVRKQRFREVMAICSGGRFVIKAKQKKSDGRGIFREEFSNGVLNQTPQVGTLPTAVQGIPKEDVQDMISKALQADRVERRLAELEAENKELNKALAEADSVTNRVLGRVEPYIGQLLAVVAGKFMPQAPAVALGTTTEQIPEFEPTENQPKIDMNELEQRLADALQKWSKADPDYLELLEVIATMAETKDPMYNMAKTMLKK